MEQKGLPEAAGAWNLADIGAELRKTYSHPTLTVQGVHKKFEALPEEVTNAARHAECLDCHNAHLTEKNNPLPRDQWPQCRQFQGANRK